VVIAARDDSYTGVVGTRFTDLVGCDLPIQQAGMGPVATPALARAVAAAGALGSIGAAAMPREHLRAALQDLRDEPVCVNFLMPFLDREAVEIAGAGARVVEFFYGDPDRDLVALARAHGARVSWQVGSVAEAIAAARAGVDLIVAQGVEAGGHVRGETPLAELLSSVRAAVDLPIVAAGGIGSASEVTAAMAAGADGVRAGTRFVAAEEADAHPAYVDALIAAAGTDTVLTERFGFEWPNAPHRVLRRSLEAAEEPPDGAVGVTRIGDIELPVMRFSTMLPTRASTGNIAAMAHYAGMSVGEVRRVEPAAAIIRELAAGLDR